MVANLRFEREGCWKKCWYAQSMHEIFFYHNIILHFYHAQRDLQFTLTFTVVVEQAADRDAHSVLDVLQN